MLFHNAARNHQTDTRTGFLKVHGILGSIIFVKNIALLLFRNADTRILHFNSPLLSCSLHQYVNDSLLCILQGIGEQIVYDMIHLLPVNPNLARVQTEGGIGQGIGMALYENVTYNAGGKIADYHFRQYKIPIRQDVGHINVEFETSYEPSGPFGVKSIGEIVINTPAPALAHAIYRATGVWHRTVPFTPEKILMGMADPNWHEKDLRVK